MPDSSDYQSCCAGGGKEKPGWLAQRVGFSLWWERSQSCVSAYTRSATPLHPHPLPGSSLSCQAGTPGMGEVGREESRCEAFLGSPEVFQICSWEESWILTAAFWLLGMKEFMSAREVLVMVLFWVFCSSGLLKELTGTSLQSAKSVSAGMLVGVNQKAS